MANDGRLGLGSKLGYATGDFGTNLVLNATTVYLLYYLTDVSGVSAAFGGVIFLVAKLWNALIDPLVGQLVDHTQTRWGRKRPWLLFGALPFGLAFALCFAGPSLAPPWREAWSMATYILFCTALGATNIPYSSLTATMTRDPAERSSLSGWRMSLAILGTMAASVAVKPLVSLFGGGPQGFRAVGIAFGLVVAACLLVVFLSSRETSSGREENRGSFRENVRALAANGPFILLALALVFCTVANYLVATSVNYYFKYVLGKEGLIQYGFLALFLAAIACVPLWLAVSRRFSKRVAFMAGGAVLLCALIPLWFLRSPSDALVLGILVAAGCGISTVYLFPWAMVPDTVEYSEWKTGATQEGFLYGFFVFGLKLAQALAGFLAGFALEASGYAANRTQTEGALRGITFIFTLLPAGLMALGLAFLTFYPIDMSFHARINAELAERRRAAP
jgi:GPH family glycoside/pentoside/hexuronide:cation symporter